MADRTFTEGEAYALVDDGVKRETAARDTRISELEGENTALKNTNDVLTTEKAAETQRADQAAQALIDYKDGIEQEKARAQLRTERVAAVTDATPLLKMTDERADRIVAMDDETFTSYVKDLREIAESAAAGAKCPKCGAAVFDAKATKCPKCGAAMSDNDGDEKQKANASGDLPRQSAAFGSTTETQPLGTVKGVIGASRALRAS
jgi:rubrerythrin